MTWGHFLSELVIPHLKPESDAITEAITCFIWKEMFPYSVTEINTEEMLWNCCSSIKTRTLKYSGAVDITAISQHQGPGFSPELGLLSVQTRKVWLCGSTVSLTRFIYSFIFCKCFDMVYDRVDLVWSTKLFTFWKTEVHAGAGAGARAGRMGQGFCSCAED